MYVEDMGVRWKFLKDTLEVVEKLGNQCFYFLLNSKTGRGNI